jgi:hypothetical protein
MVRSISRQRLPPGRILSPAVASCVKRDFRAAFALRPDLKKHASFGA